MKHHLTEMYLLGIFIRFMAGGIAAFLGMMIAILLGFVLFVLGVPDIILNPLMAVGMAILGIIFFLAGFERTKFVHILFH